MGNQVTATAIPSGAQSHGTRDGNTITLTREGTSNGETFSVRSVLTLTSNRSMSGERTDTYANGSKVVWNVEGSR